MYPLLLCSIVTWAVIFERLYRFARLKDNLERFHWEATHAVLRGEMKNLPMLCDRFAEVPNSILLREALIRLESNDPEIKKLWRESVERRRQMLNQDLKKYLWILGTLGSACPFIGLFGTVVGILKTFHDLAQSGTGGFAVVASGISEALVATAAGIIVAVIAVMAYNAFQTRWGSIVMTLRLQTEELMELLGSKLANQTLSADK